MGVTDESNPSDFVQDIINADIKSNRWNGRVITRFPPEPNGYLHIGHAKSICLNFGLARKFGGVCHLRFDDTNPTKETQEYVDSIKEDILWLGWDWGDHIYYTSDYFQKLFEMAIDLIKQGKAYVDDLSTQEIRDNRGTLTTPGTDSPYRRRDTSENMELFKRMRNGDFTEGSRVLRARIDMASSNLNLRDPVLYRIVGSVHHHSGDAWPIYPMYDFAHGQADSIEGITHSLCTLEFEDHRPLYDWLLNHLEIDHPQQIEFARLNLSYTLLSKRKLLKLVTDGHVSGWNDPRMPTLSGLRRRGYSPTAIRKFCDVIGVAKRQTTIELALLEHCLREDLNKHTPRVMAVLRPLKVVIDNYPADQVEEFQALNNPEDKTAGTRSLPFSREIYIESDDFREDPPPKFNRLAPNREVRLRYGYFITCREVIKDRTTGRIVELHCTYDPETRGGQAPDGRKVSGTIHWVSVPHAVQAEVRLYDQLFTVPRPEEIDDYTRVLNPDSLQILTSCQMERSLVQAVPGNRYQFERVGYFCVDTIDSRIGKPIFNRTVALRDSWSSKQRRD